MGGQVRPGVGIRLVVQASLLIMGERICQGGGNALLTAGLPLGPTEVVDKRLVEQSKCRLSVAGVGFDEVCGSAVQ